MKQRICASSLSAVRPADSLTMDAGIMMRAAAIMRTISKAFTGSRSASGVPSAGAETH
jgi:hypothetical protein